MKGKNLLLFFLALVVFVGCSCLPVSPAKNDAIAGEKIVAQQEEDFKTISLTRDEKIKLIDDIHLYSVVALGFKPTTNCSVFNENYEMSLYEFFAPELETPYSYESKCPEDLRFDRFAYYPSANAGREYGPNFLNESPSRIIYVVFHEIWHGQVELDMSWEEAMGTVVGYAAGLKYAEEKFGKNTNIYQDLNGAFSRYLLHSQINNDAWDSLNSLYNEYKVGNISKEDALKAKKEILISTNDSYLELLGAAPSYELNNASIGYNMTYTRHSPLILKVYITLKIYIQKCQENVLELMKIFKQ